MSIETKEKLTAKLDVQAIKEAGIDIEDQIDKYIEFEGLVKIRNKYNSVLEIFRDSGFNDARIRQIVCQIYSIVFKLDELTENDCALLKELELYILLPEKMGVIQSH